MRQVLVLLYVTLILAASCALGEDKPANKLDFFLDRAIPHFAAGGRQWQTTLIFHNPSDEPEKFYLNFYGDDGQPVSIPVLGATYPSLLVTLPPHTTRKVVTDYRPDLPAMWGSASIDDPYTCADCNFFYSTVHTIFAMYDWQSQRFLCEATVPQESPYDNDVVLVYDNESSYVTSLAIMNPSTYEIKKVTATVYDKDNTLLRTEQFYMDPLTHQAFELAGRWPEAAARLGYVKFSTEGTGGIAGIGLRFSPNGTFTSMHFVSAD